MVIGDANTKMHPSKNDTCINLLQHEKPQLSTLPRKGYTYYHERERKVNNNGTISFNHIKYSVPEIYKGERLTVRYNEKLLFIIYKEEVVAKYNVSGKKKQRKHRVWYMLNKLRTKSEGFIQSEEYRSMTNYEKLLFNKVFNKSSNDFIAFLYLVKDKSRNLIKKLVLRYKENLDFLTVDHLLDHVLLT